jgi:nucleoside-diphosphate-sugar epimerase
MREGSDMETIRSNHNGHDGNGNNGHSGNGHSLLGEVVAEGKPSRKPRGHVVVIGGAGFVGSALIPKLLARDYRVTVLDAFLFGTDSVVASTGRRRLRLVQGDLRSVESVVRGCRDASAIVHLGGLVGDPACAHDAVLTLQINLEATAMIAEVARGMGIPRLVFASTCAVYGASDDQLDEESPLAPVSIYAQSKAESEHLLMAGADDAFSPTALRFGTFYGLSARPRFDLVVNLLTAKAVCEGSISIFGGSQWRPFIHVDDGADAIVKCLEAPRDVVSGQVFNVGSDRQNYTLAQVAELIQLVVPDAEVVYEEQTSEEANYHVSFEKIRRELDFTARRSLIEGICQIKAAVESEAIGDYQQARYNNYKSLASGDTAELLGKLASPVSTPSHASVAAS